MANAFDKLKKNMKAKKAIKSHAKDETDFGKDFSDLPPGISGGIARLSECTFGEYSEGTVHAGEPFFRAAGVVVTPKKIGDMHVEGLQTSILEPLCDTTTRRGKKVSLSDHIANVLNELRKLGADTSKATITNLEEICASVKEEAPMFKFSTTPRKDQETGEVIGSWENWFGTQGLDDDDDDADDDDVDDEEEEDDEGENEGEDEDEEEEDDGDDNGDDGDDDDDDDDEPFVPEKGDVYDYRPQKAKNDVEVKVVKVLKRKETCDLKNIESGKVYKAVKWEKLQ